MDRRSWPWKKKSSDKSAATAEANGGGPLSSPVGHQNDKDGVKPVKYLKITAESYAHLTECEEQVKALNEKLSSALSEVTSKDELAKQHAKVAEEAVSGWEKAEAEALALKQQLENSMLQKLTADERSSHLDGALKECMKQIRNVKEEGEHKLQDVIFSKTRQWEKLKSELDGRMAGLEKELLMASAENATVMRALQERTSALMEVSDEKTQADAQIEMLKGDIQSCEKEISSLKYELHISSKELEIRNEEKNMTLRSAEVANKQHLEDIKKITKLETECQRLRVLVRKKLPGPAALAQMKHEVDSLGRDYGETRARRSSDRGLNPRLGSAPDFALESYQQCQKENEFLTERLLAMDEEMKMLKEALTKRNTELQASRCMFAKTATKLRTMETSMYNHQKSSSNPSMDLNFETSFHDSNPSMTSMSEDGFDEEGSSAQSAPPISGLLQSKVGRHTGTTVKVESSSQADLMDDFLEMERLACLSSESNEPSTFTDGATNRPSVEAADVALLVDDAKPGEAEHMPSTEDQETGVEAADTSSAQLAKKQELENAISQIHDLVLSLSKEATENWEASPGFHELSERIQDFSTCVSRVLTQHMILDDFIVSLSKVLCEARCLSSCLLHKHGEGDNISDFIDKVALLENKVAHNEPSQGPITGDGSFIPQTTSDPEVDGLMSAGFDVKATEQKYDNTEDLERLKLEKENGEVELAKCRDSLSQTRAQLVEAETRLEQLQTQLASSQKSNGLSETQLKCMAESYKMLEARAQDLETEINHLRKQVETLTDELGEERNRHQEVLSRYKDLQEKIESAEADVDINAKQEKEIAAAAEMLAECQESIFLLSKQLNAMRPTPTPPDNTESSFAAGLSDDEPSPNRLPPRGMPSPCRAGGEPMTPPEGYTPCMSPSDATVVESNMFPARSPTGSKPQRQQQRPAASSSSASSTPPQEKHGRRFSGFFSKSRGELL